MDPGGADRGRHTAGTVGIIGCGSMGARHAEAFIAAGRSDPSLHVTHVCDRDLTRARQVAELFASADLPVPAATDRMDELLGTGSPDAVDVVLPTAAHHEVCVRALGAGKHVLVEKPLALDVKQGTAMVDAAAAGDRVLSVAENYRRLAANRALRALLDRSGGVVTMSSEVVCSPTFDRRHNAAAWYADPGTAGSYLGHEFGAHEMDLVRYLLGEVDSVYCVPYFSPHEQESDPRRACGLFALLRCESGAVAHVALRSAEAEQPHGTRSIVLADGHVSSDAWEVWDGRHVGHDGAPTVTGDFVATGRPFFDRNDPLRNGTAAAVHEFARAVAGELEPEIDGADAARTLAICESLIRSARTGAPVSPTELLDR